MCMEDGSSARLSSAHIRSNCQRPGSGSATAYVPSPVRTPNTRCSPVTPSGPAARTWQPGSQSRTTMMSIAEQGIDVAEVEAGHRGTGKRDSGDERLPPYRRYRSSPPPLAATMTENRPLTSVRASPPLTSVISSALRNVAASGTLVTLTPGTGLPAASTRPRTTPLDRRRTTEIAIRRREVNGRSPELRVPRNDFVYPLRPDPPRLNAPLPAATVSAASTRRGGARDPSTGGGSIMRKTDTSACAAASEPGPGSLFR